MMAGCLNLQSQAMCSFVIYTTNKENPKHNLAGNGPFSEMYTRPFDVLSFY